MSTSTINSLIAQWDYCNGDVCQRPRCKRCRRAEEFCVANRKESIRARVDEVLYGGGRRKRAA